MKPKKIQVLEKNRLYIKWNDESESEIDLKLLRDECPCASCKGETILFKTLRPPSISVKNTNMYEITDIQIVGGYAIQVKWKDGHNTGIYTFNYLKQLSDDKNSGDYNYKPLL